MIVSTFGRANPVTYRRIGVSAYRRSGAAAQRRFRVFEVSDREAGEENSPGLLALGHPTPTKSP